MRACVCLHVHVFSTIVCLNIYIDHVYSDISVKLIQVLRLCMHTYCLYTCKYTNSVNAACQRMLITANITVVFITVVLHNSSIT